MILLSASLMLRSSERKVEVGIVSLSLSWFCLYFIGDFIFALGFLKKIPPLLAGFGPTLIGLFSGCYLISDIDEIKRINKTGALKDEDKFFKFKNNFLFYCIILFCV